MNTEIQARLQRNRKLAEKIDVAACCAVLIPLVIALVWSVWDSYVTVFDASSGIRIAIILMLGHLGFQAGRWLLTRLKARFAPSFVIDGSDPNVVKLHGSIRLDGADRAEEKLLESRPGLQMYRGNAYEEFGCTLAAVPATPGFLKAKAALQKFDISIK